MQVYAGPFDMTHPGYLTSVYGGIEFGLDRFELAQRHTLRWVNCTAVCVGENQLHIQ